MYLTVLLNDSSMIDYCPFLRMFSTRVVNHKINRHEIGLGALLNNKTSTFNAMLSKSKNTTIPVQNIQKFDD